MKKLIFITICIFLGSCQFAYAQSNQIDCKSKLETANQRVVKLADNLTKVKAELGTALEKNALQKELNDVLINLLTEYAKLPEKEKKSFWKKAKEKLTGFLDKATDPDTLSRLATILIILEARK